MMCGNKHHLQLMGRCAREWEGGREGEMRVGRCMAGGWADERVCGQLVGKEGREGGREGEKTGNKHTHTHTHLHPGTVRRRLLEYVGEKHVLHGILRTDRTIEGNPGQDWEGGREEGREGE